MANERKPRIGSATNSPASGREIRPVTRHSPAIRRPSARNVQPGTEGAGQHTVADTEHPTRMTGASGGQRATAATDFRDRHDQRFEFGHELGRGGLGAVFAATDRFLQRSMAVKVLHDAATSAAAAKFIAEARITGQLQHPNIVPIYDLAQTPDGTLLLSMKQINGRTLGQLIAEAHRECPHKLSGPRRRLLGMFLKICDAIAYAHSQRVIHRDLKPDNVMVGEFGDVMVLDWGLAKVIDRAAANAVSDGEESAGNTARGNRKSASRVSPRPPSAVNAGRRGGGSSRRREMPATAEDAPPRTLAGTVKGTPGFMSPEQAHGLIDALDERADIFALGGMLYMILSGKLPVEGANTEEWLAANRDYDLVSPAIRAPRAGIPRELAAVVMKAMQRRKKDRYETVGELAAEVQRFLDGEPVAAYRYNAWQRLVKWVMRHPTRSMGTGISLMFLAVLALVVSIWQTQAADAERQTAQSQREAAEARALAAIERERTQRLAQEQREARLRELMQADEIDALRDELGAKRRQVRDHILLEYTGRWEEAQKSSLDNRRLFGNLSPEKITEYLTAFDKLIEAHEKHGVEIAATDFFHRGVLWHMGRGEAAKGIADYDKALAMKPDFPMAYNNRGAARMDLGDIDGALADYQRAIDLEPNHVTFYFNRGNVFSVKGDMARALADFDRCAELAPKLWDIYNNRGAVYTRLRQFDQALADFDRAIDLNPNYAEAFANRASVRRQMRNYAGALADCNRAIELLPNAPESYLARGNVYAGMRDTERALADIDHALDLRPELWQAWNSRAAVTQHFDIPETIRALQMAYRLCPMPDYRQQIATSLRKFGGTVPE